jgi:uncharacterized protein (TIGR00730 family)
MKNNKKKNRSVFGNKVPLYSDPELPAVKEDFRKTFEWRVFKIMAEFIDGFHFLADFKKTVTVFGSTVLPETNKHYQEARKFGALMAKKGYSMVTGGGPGIMEAANRGCFEAGKNSIGINIDLAEGQRMNEYVNKPIGFNYFFTRKVMLSFSSEAYVFFPGGFGTLDEFFEMVTLVQTKKLGRKVPIIVVGIDYWEPLLKWIKDDVYGKYGAIKKTDFDIINIATNAEEALKLVLKLSSKKA